MEGEEYERTEEDVKKVIEHAKLDEKELRPVTQVLYTSSEEADYKLLELEPEVLVAMNEGQSIVFRGDTEAKAVLCTEKSTFDVKEAETSNSLLVVPELLFEEDAGEEGEERSLKKRKIMTVHNDYLEIKKMKPKLTPLRKAMEVCTYNGVELEKQDQTCYPTTENLLDGMAQCSRTELVESLSELGAFQMEGRWRILGPDYEFRCVSFLLNLIEENSWELDCIPIGQTLMCLCELLPRRIVDHILDTYLIPSGDINDEGEELYILDSCKCSRVVAGTLLRSLKKFDLDDFIETWRQSMPEGTPIRLEDLGGLALYDTTSVPRGIWHYPESDLPEDPKERFDELFKVRKKWSHEEIEPYVKNLTTEKQPVSSLLTKYSRCCIYQGEKYYYPRHGK